MNGTNGKTTVHQEQLYTPDEVAELLEISTARAYMLIRTEIPFVLRNRCRLVRSSDLDKFIHESPAYLSLPTKRHRLPKPKRDPSVEPCSLSDQITVRLDQLLEAPKLHCEAPDIPAKKVEVVNHEPPAHRIDTTEVIVISRFKVIADWLKSHQINATWLQHVPTSTEIKDKHVVAHALPHWLELKAKSVSWVDCPGLNLETATVDDLDQAKAQIITLDIHTTANPEPLWLDGVPF